MFKQFDPLELVSKKPHTVVLMLDSPEEHVLQSACEALYKFAEKCELGSFLLFVQLLTGVIQKLAGKEWEKGYEYLLYRTSSL